jgi:hypothetical protein
LLVRAKQHAEIRKQVMEKLHCENNPFSIRIWSFQAHDSNVSIVKEGRYLQANLNSHFGLVDSWQQIV